MTELEERFLARGKRIDKTDERYSLGEIGRMERDIIVDALQYEPTAEAITYE